MKAIHLVVGVSLSVVFAVACESSPAAPFADSTCSIAALHGAYGALRDGQTAPGTLFTAVGVVTFDGQGNLTANQTVSLNGAFSTAPNQTGTYTMNADCTGTESDASGQVISQLTMVHAGDEVLGLSVLPGNTVNIHYERIKGPCSNGTLNGIYGFQRYGTAAGGIPLVAVGTVVFDGNGKSVASQIIDRGGKAGALVQFPGVYTLNSDCVGVGFDTTGKALGPLVVVHGGDEVLGLSQTAGNNVVVHYERVKE